MDYVLMCSKCATLNIDGGICTECGSTHINIHLKLYKVVEMLIKMGVGVLSSEIHHSSNSSVRIYLAKTVPEHLFDELPNNWQLVCYEIKSLNIKSYRLYCCPDKDDTTYNIDKMIQNLEEWATDKDPDGFKSLLKLSGYDIGQ